MVSNSKFITTLSPVKNVDDAKLFIKRIRNEFNDASHNVPAYIIGHGSSVVMHSSDDGEPSGTAGRPMLTVLMGSKLGNVGIVTTRYFGGTKLGTGGLVRAYTNSVKEVLKFVEISNVIPATNFSFKIPYHVYERIRKVLDNHMATILKETFLEEITISAKLPSENLNSLEKVLMELSNGKWSLQDKSEDEILQPYK
jgi:uncharacterized YigZ family protein